LERLKEQSGFANLAVSKKKDKKEREKEEREGRQQQEDILKVLKVLSKVLSHDRVEFDAALDGGVHAKVVRESEPGVG